MIAERDTTRTVASTIEGEVIQMGIDQNAMAHIMNVLTDLYSNPELAIVREYSTNALDAHIEAGVKRPIEVTTPSPLSPFLRIKDHGVGLDANDIREIYSQYGNSTKRSTNDQVGMLGLGCKSALTYTDNFVVVSVKDGVQIEVSVERDENGAGVMKRPTAKPTDAPNGTEIIIPAKARNTIDAIAKKFFSFWQPGTVLLNGAEPERIKGLDLYDDGRYIVIDGETDYIVMGNVPYPVEAPLEIKHGLPSSWRNRKTLVAFVGIGDVNFPPSRETLMATAKTKATIARVGQEANAGVAKAVQREIENAPSARDAVQAYVKHIDLLGGSHSRGAGIPYKYKGAPLPTNFTPTKQLKITPRGKYSATSSPTLTGMLVTDSSDYKMSASDPHASYPVGSWNESLFLYGYDAMAVTPSQKRKMRQYVADNLDFHVRKFVLIAEKPDAQQMEWLGEERVKPWADVKAIKLPTNPVAAKALYGRLPGSYDLHDQDGCKRGVAGDDIDQSKPIFWTPQTSRDAHAYAVLMRKHMKEFYIVTLAANRVEKFKRIIPTAKTAKEAVVDLWKAASAKFTADELLALHIADNGLREDFKVLAGKNILDPAILEAVRLSQINLKSAIDTRYEFSRVVDTDTLSPVQWSNPLESYPLYNTVAQHSYRSSHILREPDLIFYLNAKYTATKGA